MTNRFARDLSPGRKLMLAAVAVAAATGPFAFGVVSAGAQTPTEEQSFEAAMLRLEDPHSTVDYNRPDAPNQTRAFPANRFIMFHTYLKSLIADAYGVDYEKILGGPAWLTSQHYDLSAKVEGETRLTRKQMQPLLRNLLKERVHLAVHSERRIVPGYGLVIAKGGSRLKPNAGAPFGGIQAIDELKFQGASAEVIAKMIAGSIKQPVIDKTGLAGTYDFDLKFVPESAPSGYVPRNPDSGYIFSAIQEQLGLKLVKQQVPVDYLVIDHVERVPIEN